MKRWFLIIISVISFSLTISAQNRFEENAAYFENNDLAYYVDMEKMEGEGVCMQLYLPVECVNELNEVRIFTNECEAHRKGFQFDCISQSNLF